MWREHHFFTPLNFHQAPTTTCSLNPFPTPLLDCVSQQPSTTAMAITINSNRPNLPKAGLFKSRPILPHPNNIHHSSSQGNKDTHKPFSCIYPDCPATFCRSDQLREHWESHKGTQRKFKCPVKGCGRHYYLQESLRRHLDWHRKEDLGKKSKMPVRLRSLGSSLKKGQQDCTCSICRAALIRIQQGLWK